LYGSCNYPVNAYLEDNWPDWNTAYSKITYSRETAYNQPDDPYSMFVARCRFEHLPPEKLSPNSLSDFTVKKNEKTANVQVAVESEASLINQPCGPQLEYRVKTVNIGGESIPSNTVPVVL